MLDCQDEGGQRERERRFCAGLVFYACGYCFILGTLQIIK